MTRKGRRQGERKNKRSLRPNLGLGLQGEHSPSRGLDYSFGNRENGDWGGGYSGDDSPEGGMRGEDTQTSGWNSAASPRRGDENKVDRKVVTQGKRRHYTRRGGKKTQAQTI